LPAAVFVPSRASQLCPATVKTGKAATWLSLVCSHKCDDASQLVICMCGSWMSNLYFFCHSLCAPLSCYTNSLQWPFHPKVKLLILIKSIVSVKCVTLTPHKTQTKCNGYRFFCGIFGVI
jgi:hypothetical protein